MRERIIEPENLRVQGIDCKTETRREGPRGKLDVDTTIAQCCSFDQRSRLPDACVANVPRKFDGSIHDGARQADITFLEKRVALGTIVKVIGNERDGIVRGTCLEAGRGLS
ncbi:hypothetical protein SAMN05421850_1432 [Lutimaribacter saemankumensis]|uniref:Uncharacterized protein n=1 Tax=Lutimaribacter saemankumensis TaxID=490829 RepID=A0A1G8TXP9_9RHOB|nr:hypothetical protein SAMN05421850_1432 [Lutimaribacter saemankumensis]